MSLSALALIAAFLVALIGTILKNWLVVAVAVCIALGALVVTNFGVR